MKICVAAQDVQSENISMKVASMVADSAGDLLAQFHHQQIILQNLNHQQQLAASGAATSHHHNNSTLKTSATSTFVSQSSVSDILQLELLGGDSSCLDSEDALFVGDLGEIVRQYQRWNRNLPRIDPFYAIKCNTDPMVLTTLAALGIGFDCASRNEISTVLDLGVHPSKIIYANPCKQASHISYAYSQNVRRMTFDNAEELYKVKKHHPTAELVLRIITDDSHSVCKFSTKFGASLDKTLGLLLLAKELDLNVIGVSFHVGSGCYDANAFRDAVLRARKVFDQAELVGFEFDFLDVGGGFPGNYKYAVSFEQIASVLGPAVDEFFPSHVRVIAEPGRFFVATAFTLAVNVTARRTVESDDEDKSFMFYVNDGVYGSFNCILFDHVCPEPKVLIHNGRYMYGSSNQSPHESVQMYKCSVWGPTCDSMDCITKTGNLPELDIGDWMYFENMGAYTIAAASTFNGFKRTNITYTNTEIISQL